MKLIPRDSRHGISIFRLALTLTIAALVPLLAYATAPAWWSHRAVLVQNGTADDYALVNQGQLKNIARAAATEMDAGLPGGAGNTLHALVDAWASPTAQTNDFAPVNLGQLKNIAKPFYDRLIAAGLAGDYPWSGNPNQPDDFALANIGQVKKLFSFDLPNPLYDGDGNGLPDAWEQQHFGHLGVDPNADPDGDGFTNLQEYQNATDPHDYYNGASFDLDIASGNGQQVSPGAWLPQPLVVRVTNDVGVALSNAPVTFSVTSSGGALSVALGGTQVSSFECRTDATGNARVYYQAPAAERLAVITAQTQSVGNVQQVNFTASTIGANFPFVGLKLWLRGDAGVVKDTSNAISQWIDGTGSGNDALQSSPVNEPSYAADSINGKPVVRFDGVDDMFGLGDVMQSAAAGELFVVLRATGDPAANHGFMTFGPGGWGQWALYPDAGGNVQDNFGGTMRNTGRVPQALDQFHLYNAVSKPGEWTSRINGVVQYTTSSNTVGFTPAPVIGSSGSPFNGPFQGDIAEILVFDRALSQVERDAVEQYLGTKYPVLAAPPTVPAMLQGAPIAPTQVGLSWTYDLGNGSTFFNVERTTPGGTFQEIAIVRDSASYVDSAALAGASYIYRVRATNYSGQSDYSVEVSVTTPLTGAAMPSDGMRVWLKADAGTTNPMISWVNQAPFGGQALQGLGDNQPLVIAGGIGSKPVVRFDGANDTVGLTDVMQGATEGELFVVLRATGDPAANHGFMTFGPGGWGQWALYPDAGGNIQDNFGGTMRNTGRPGQALDQFHLYNTVSTPGEWTSRINGVVQYTTNSNAVGFTPAPVIGSSGSPFNGSFQGDIAEIIIYDHALAQAERDAVQRYVGAKYPVLTPPPSIPTGLQAIGLSPTQISLFWTYNLGNGTTMFIIERSVNGGPFVQIAVVRNAGSYIDDSVEANGCYQYRIRAINSTGTSDYTTQVGACSPATGVAMPLDGMRVWLKADTGTTNPMISWTNQAPLGGQALQGFGDNQPVVVAEGIGGKPVVRFDGANDTVGLTDVMQGATGAELFVVLRATGDPAANHGFMTFGPGGWGQWALYPDAGGNIQDNFGGTMRNTGRPGQALDQFHLYNTVSKSGEWTSRINGVVQYTTSSNTVAFTPAPVIGSSGSPFNGSFQGDIAEIIIYDHALSQPERDAVQLYLGAKYPVLTPPPSVPTALQAIGLSPTQVSLFWNYDLGNVTTMFIIERSTNGGPFVQIAVVRNAGSYIDDSVQADVSYQYRIRASNSTGVSDYTSQVAVTTPATGVAMPLDGMRVWLKADAGTTNPMISWANQAPYGGQALQGLGDNQPLVIADGIGGKPVVRFDGANDTVGLTDVMQGATEGELFVVLRATGDPAANHGFMTFGPGGWGQWALYPDAGGNIQDNFGGTMRNTGRVPQALDQFHLYNAVSKPGEWTSRINGVVQYTTSSNTVGFTTAPVIGSSGSPFNGSFQGDIAEIIVYDHGLSQAERDAVEHYIGTKYPVLASPPAVPTMLRGEAIAPSQVGLSWTYDLGNGSTFFNVERKTPGGVFQEVAVTRDSASYIDTTTLGGTSYIYRVRATNYSGQSGYSTELAIVTPSVGTPVPLSGMRLWLKADAGTTNPMISWVNQAPNGGQALQGAGDNQPLVIANQIEGKPVVRFDGANDTVGLTDVMQEVTEGDLFVVLRATGDPAANHGFMTFGPGGWGQWALYPDAGGNIQDNFGGTLRNTGKPLQPLDEIHLYEALSKPGEWTNRVNGVVQYTTNSNTVLFTPAPVIGSSGSPFNGSFQGDIAEIIIYDHALSTVERERVQWYLADKYLIPGYDLDNDGLTNAEEQVLGTDPHNWDSNGDGISDGISQSLGINPANLDNDGDGISNADELILGTNPFSADTDGDGVPDGLDAFPLDPTRWQLPSTPGDVTPPGITLFEPAGATPIP